ncbi:MAG: DUF3300 domain-containing protein [Terriglobales bacterium]
MNTFECATEFSWSRWGRQSLISLLSITLLCAMAAQKLYGMQDAPAAAQAAPAAAQAAQAPPYAQQTPEQLHRLVAPIALYPDSLVAQILAASTFPEQVVEADRWVQANPDLKGDALGKAVDQQPWDPSVKALAAFPSVLGNMDKNLSWASSLGDAYFNQQADVMDAVQVMRRRAQAAGGLKTTEQQTVTTQGSTIDVEPANPDVVYVPAYDPWLVYGDPIMAWPGWYPYPGIWFGGPYLSWGGGFGIGWFGGYGWGWNHWGFNWGGRYAMYGGGRYYSRSNTFYNRSNFYRAGSTRGVNGNRGETGARNAGNRGAGERGEVNNRGGATSRAFNGNTKAARGYAEPRGQSGTRTGAFSGYGKGGQARSASSRGAASMGGGMRGGGGGGARGGGGGSHGGSGGGHH